jgi:hypothetical protein
VPHDRAQRAQPRRWVRVTIAAELAVIAVVATLIGLHAARPDQALRAPPVAATPRVTPTPTATPAPTAEPAPAPEPEPAAPGPETPAPAAAAAAPPVTLDIVQDQRAEFDHGPKPAAYQRYIVLHDTESWSDPAGVISYWAGSGAFVASHFVIGVDGTVRQAVPLDAIAHHAGVGDTGHNALSGITEDGRDDRRGTVPIGTWASDYAMNAWSVGIELVHVGGSGAGSYPEAQLEALDQLIAYIDAYYGFPSAIIDHKDWRSGNSDTSPEFAAYRAKYKDHRPHHEFSRPISPPPARRV